MKNLKNWPVVPLRQAADIAAGITMGRKTPETDLVSVPYLRVANVQDGLLNLAVIKYVEVTRREIEKWRLQDGDLLLTEGGDLDKLGRGACWRGQLPLCIHQNHIFRLRFPSERYDPDFVSLQAGSPYGKAYFFAHAKKTTGIASINQQVLGSFPLLSPPLPEQQRIVGELKAQLAAAEEARQAAQAQLNEIRLLKIQALKAVFSAIKDSAPLGDVARIQSGYAFKSETFQKHGVRLLRNANIAPGRVYWDDAVFLAPSAAEAHAAYTLAEGDVLISLDRPIIKTGIKVARVTATDLPALLVQRVGRFRIDTTRLNADYLYAFLHTEPFIEAVSGHEQSLGVPHISPGQIEAIDIPLPTLVEQQRLAVILNSIADATHEAHIAAEQQLRDIELLPSRLLATVFDMLAAPSDDE